MLCVYDAIQLLTPPSHGRPFKSTTQKTVYSSFVVLNFILTWGWSSWQWLWSVNPWRCIFPPYIRTVITPNQYVYSSTYNRILTPTPNKHSLCSVEALSYSCVTLLHSLLITVSHPGQYQESRFSSTCTEALILRPGKGQFPSQSHNHFEWQ